MNISENDTAAANAAITTLNSALATHGSQAGPHAKDLYEGSTLHPLVTAAAALAVNLGRTLYAEQIAAAQSALAPFCANNVERDRLTHELTVPKQILGWVNGIATDAATPARAVNTARLIVSILTSALAAAS